MSSNHDFNQNISADDPEDNTTKEPQHQTPSFSIVGIGASAGGLEAFTQLLASLPINTGMAFVLIQHLAPSHKSLLTEILGRATKMPVLEVHDLMTVEPDYVYIIPPNTNMAIAEGQLILTSRDSSQGKYLPIDFFFNSLAESCGNKAIGVILSGGDGDGTRGIEAIKAAGGITFAQDSESSKFGSMPDHAVASGSVDFILSPLAIAQELANISRHPYLTLPAQINTKEFNTILQTNENELNQIFALLNTVAHVDFQHYKKPTIKRRIMRRMLLNHQENLPDYLQYLQENPTEVKALYEEILINVTSFFRDYEAFEALKETVFPSLIANRNPEIPMRIWVPGCSTGEEVYSIAMCLIEFLSAQNQRRQAENTELTIVNHPLPINNSGIKIFGTDISTKCIEKARLGMYSNREVIDISQERLRRFFFQTDSGYKVNKLIREMCIFSNQNIIQDPPFSKLDLISCRNTLIYLDPVLQNKIIPLFHYALNPTGFLFLGTAESANGFADLFTLINKKYKIYTRKLAPNRFNFSFPAHNNLLDNKTDINKTINQDTWSIIDVQKEADRIVLIKYAPVGVVINSDMEIIQFRGQTSAYLAPAPGIASLNLLNMAREGLSLDLRTTIHKATKQNTSVRKEGLQFKSYDGIRYVNIDVSPFKVSGHIETYFLVLFEDVIISSPEDEQKKMKKSLKPKQKRLNEQKDQEIEQLKQELIANKEYLQSIIQEQEAKNEELKVANEEILSSNEELQSTNEELETAKEEIQSTNEELKTINEELQNRNLELNQINNDFNNLLNTVQIPIVIVGNDLCIRLFTPKAKTVLNLIPSDIGRPIRDIHIHFDIPNLEELISNVINQMLPYQQEVQYYNGYWYFLKILPYKTLDNRIDGAVMVFMDIDAIKKTTEQLREARDYADAIIETVRSPLVVIDGQWRIKRANKAFYTTFQLTDEQTEQQSIFEIWNQQWNTPEIRAIFSEIIVKDHPMATLEISNEFLNMGNKTILLNACKISCIDNQEPMILLAMEDITERKQIELERSQLLIYEQQTREVAEKANRAKDEFLSMLSHELRNPLNAILGWSRLLLTNRVEESKISHAIEVIDRSAHSQARLIEDLLDISRITTGRLELNVQLVDILSVLTSAIEIVQLSADAKKIQIESVFNPINDLRIMGDTDRLHQLFWNLLTNAIKFTPEGGRIEVRCSLETIEGKQYARIEVSDNGIGIEPEILPLVFERFRQADSSSTKLYAGLGLGLTIVRYLVELHGGTIMAASAGKGQGATFTVRFPLQAISENSVSPPLIQPEALKNQQKIVFDDTPQLDGVHILIVDDNQDSLDLLNIILEQFGADVRAVDSVAAAMSILRAEDWLPDILISDIAMPPEDGYSLIRQVRALPSQKMKNIPAIALTALASTEERIRALSEGFQRYVPKPMEPSQLLAVIAHLIGR